MEYLLRKSLSGRAHYWLNGDTLCRMASTNGLNLNRYALSPDTKGRPVCTMCRRRAHAHGFSIDRESEEQLRGWFK